MIQNNDMRKNLDLHLPEAFPMVNISVIFLSYTHYRQSPSRISEGKVSLL